MKCILFFVEQIIEVSEPLSSDKLAIRNAQAFAIPTCRIADDLMSDRHPASIGTLNRMVLELGRTIAAFFHSLWRIHVGNK